ncbi:MAG: hypothetical protein ACH34Y_00190 [Brachymonas sp.]
MRQQGFVANDDKQVFAQAQAACKSRRQGMVARQVADRVSGGTGGRAVDRGWGGHGLHYAGR